MILRLRSTVMLGQAATRKDASTALQRDDGLPLVEACLYKGGYTPTIWFKSVDFAPKSIYSINTANKILPWMQSTVYDLVFRLQGSNSARGCFLGIVPPLN